jgi:hypothetical protein
MTSKHNYRGPVNLNRILNAGTVAQLIAKTRAGAKIQGRLKTFLGDTAAEHFSLVRQSPQELVLLADSPVWNTYLRFRVAMILEYLREQCGMRTLEKITIKVSFPDNETTPPPNKPAELSPATASFLQQIAESTADPDLKSIYERISRHTAD